MIAGEIQVNNRIGTGAAALFLLAAGMASAEPVHIDFGSEAGAGYSFSRGSDCFVLTAAHVVDDDTGTQKATVIDRAGSRATAAVTILKEEDDVALLTVESGSIGCTTPWPAEDAPLPARMNSQTQFEVVRHYPNGRESVVLLRYAGSAPGELQLQHVDNTRIIPSDSGSLLFLGDNPAGIVKAVDPEEGVFVVPISVVREVVGWKFAERPASRMVNFGGVLQSHGQRQAQWSTFGEAWLREKAGLTVVTGEVEPRACSLQVKVVSWNQASENNPRYQSAQSQVNSTCNKKGFLMEVACSAARSTLQNTPQHQRVHRVMMEVTATPPGGGTSTTKLDTVRVVPPTELGAGAEVDNHVIRATLDQLAPKVLKAAGC
jgi:hypothetical protein